MHFNLRILTQHLSAFILSKVSQRGSITAIREEYAFFDLMFDLGYTMDTQKLSFSEADAVCEMMKKVVNKD